MILGIEIRNFDVFDSDKAGILIEDFIEKKDGGKSYNSLRGLNAFIGRNNTGKTSFMGCMAFLKDCITQGQHDSGHFKSFHVQSLFQTRR